MADIALVIKISEETYNDIQSRDWKNGELVFSEEWKAIHNGIPLPKGHGRLIDADEIIEQVNNMADELDNDYTIADIEKVGTLLESISAIIEADKESEDKE